MYTEYFGPVNREDLGCSSAHLEGAARKLQQGGLVAFPSETVYGLGATILNEGALKRLYQVKNVLKIAHFQFIFLTLVSSNLLQQISL